MINYINYIKTIEKKSKYEKTDLFKSELLYDQANNIEVYYAPFDYLNKEAKVLLLGITPGWTQMNNAYVDFINNLDIMSLEYCFQNIKKVASFSGTMRKHLVSMLDEIELNKNLNINSCASLFSKENHLVHNTSILRYPVFVDHDNYTGSKPKMLKTEILMKMIYALFIPELKALNEDIIIIPMGKAVSEVLSYLKNEGFINNSNILFNFPHPSGANGSRVKQFAEYKANFIEIIKEF
ncbi:MAG: hypothetical protein K0Q49_1327 [Haloplasmataceae bacterium]|nr:hypothetical protein [Haloplasmataceae bacterium]